MSYRVIFVFVLGIGILTASFVGEVSQVFADTPRPSDTVTVNPNDTTFLEGRICTAIETFSHSPEESIAALRECREFSTDLAPLATTTAVRKWFQERAILMDMAAVALESECFGNVPICGLACKNSQDMRRLLDWTEIVQNSLLNAPEELRLDTWVTYLELPAFKRDIETVLVEMEQWEKLAIRHVPSLQTANRPESIHPIRMMQFVELSTMETENTIETSVFTEESPADSLQDVRRIPPSVATAEFQNHQNQPSVEELLQPYRYLRFRDKLIPVAVAANTVLDKLNAPNLTPVQKSVFDTSVRQSWIQELERWHGEPVRPSDLLVAIQEYHLYGGYTSAKDIAILSRELSLSKHPAFAAFGTAVHTVFNRPNIRFFVSDEFINAILPKQCTEPEFFRQTIQDRQITGVRTADTDVRIRLLPDDHQLRFLIELEGTVTTNGQTRVARGMTIHSESFANVTGTKEVRLTDNGFVTMPATVSATQKIQYRDTVIDTPIPLFGSVGKRLAKTSFESRRAAATAESRAIVIRETRQELNGIVDQQFNHLNESMRRGVMKPVDQLGLTVDLENPQTEPQWLLSSWLLGSEMGIGGQTAPPATPEGSFADMNVHESVIHSVLEGLDIAGKTMTVGELRRLLADTFQSDTAIRESATNTVNTATQRPDGREDTIPSFAWIGDDTGEDDDVVIGFASRNPITVRFLDNRIEIALTITLLKTERQSWRNFQIIVQYRPELRTNGSTVLVRDRIVNVISTANLRTQIPLRTVVAKLFPPQQPISLTPQILATDERFRFFTTGNCRIENGWFAIAIVARPRNDSLFHNLVEVAEW